MWVELGHSHFLYVPAVSYIVTTGNGTGTKNVLKRNCACGFVFRYPIFCLQRYYCSDSKPILYLDTVYCKFLLYVSVEIDPFSCEQTSVIWHPNELMLVSLLGLVVVGVRCATGVLIADFALNCDTLNLTIFSITSPYSNLSTKTKLSTKKSLKLRQPIN